LVIIFLIITFAISCKEPFEYVNISSVIYGDYTYSVKESKACITEYNGNETVLEIPSKLGDFEVTEIGDKAFRKNDSLHQ